MSVGASLAAVMVAVYLLAGGLELGLGLLVPLVARSRDRDAVLVKGGGPWLAGALWSWMAFALLVSGAPLSLTLLPALWLPLVGLLLGLALRGAASAVRPLILRRDICDLAFGLGSLLASACQGLALGWLLDVSSVRASAAAGGGPLSLVSAWGLLGAAGVTGAYTFLAAGWLIWTGRGASRVFAREVGHAAVILTLGVAILSLAWAALTGGTGAVIRAGWLQGSAVLVPAALVFVAGGLAWRCLWSRHMAWPFACAVVVVMAVPACMTAVLEPAPLFGEVGPRATDGRFSDYLAFVLSLGSPLLLVPLRRARHLLQGSEARPEIAPDREGASQVGRRPASSANGLHLS